MAAVGLWEHAFFRGLSDSDRILVLYMLHGPQTNRIGLFSFDVLKMATDLQREPTVVERQCVSLWLRTKWLYADAPRVLFIPTWWRLFPPANVKGFKDALRDLADVPKTSSLIPRFLAYREWLKGDADYGLVLDQLTAGIPLRKAVSKVPILNVPESPAPLWETDIPVGGGPVVVATLLDDQIVRLWNEIVTPPIPKVRNIHGNFSAELRKLIRQRWKTFDRLEYYRTAFTVMNKEDWCRGASERNPGWTATLLWMMKKDEHVQRFLDRAKVYESVAKAAVSGCRHTPMCTDAAKCTVLKLKDMR